MRKSSPEEREEGLRRAIESAGSVNALARLVGISYPALLEWRRIPSHRILQIEALTGIRREELRPDLYRKSTSVRGGRFVPKRTELKK